MICIPYNNDIVEIYVLEGLRRLYAVSVNSKGCYVDFDTLYNDAYAVKLPRQKIDLHFDSYYCPRNQQLDIIKSLLDESYITPRGKVYKLNKNERGSVCIGINLGAAPNSSIIGFINDNPEFKTIIQNNSKYIESILPYLDKEEKLNIQNLLKDKS